MASLNPPPFATDPELPVCGELVVLNGRMRGARRAISGPLTLVGQASGCDVRLNVEGVQPLHCALFPGPSGLLLRDLGSAGGTIVNGEAVRTRRLEEGDEVAVGPFLFRVESLPRLALSIPGETLDAENALRIQVAAVVAQQAELTEREGDLERRRQALERQEEELAGHLEQRRRQLEGLQEDLRQDRRALKSEQEAARQEIEDLRQGVGEVRSAAAQEREGAKRERRRLVELRKRLKRRWKRHWREHEARLQRWEEELVGRRADLEKAREALAQSQLRFNGEAELGRREIQDEWQELGLAQQRWEEGLNAERARGERERRALGERARAVTEGERALARERRHWQRLGEKLRRECEGLQARIGHLRQKVQEQERLAATPGRDLAPPWAPVPAFPAEPGVVPGAIQQLADTLGDQRVHLLEQWHAFLEHQAGWQHDRASAVRDLEVWADHLRRREDRLACQEQVWADRLSRAEQEKQALNRGRLALEGWQTRLTARELAWQRKQAEWLLDLRLREELLAGAAARVEAIHGIHRGRWEEAFQELQVARAGVERLRQECLALWEQAQQAQAEAIHRQRDLDSQGLALEQARQELALGATDSAAADRRIDRYRREVKDRLLLQVQGYLVRGRRQLSAEARRLARRAGQVRQQEDRLLARQQEWERVRAEWEGRVREREQLVDRSRQERARLESSHDLDQRQLAALGAELDRLACALMEVDAPLALRISHAA